MIRSVPGGPPCTAPETTQHSPCTSHHRPETVAPNSCRRIPCHLAKTCARRLRIRSVGVRRGLVGRSRCPPIVLLLRITAGSCGTQLASPRMPRTPVCIKTTYTDHKIGCPGAGHWTDRVRVYRHHPSFDAVPRALAWLYCGKAEEPPQEATALLRGWRTQQTQAEWITPTARTEVLAHLISWLDLAVVFNCRCIPRRTIVLPADTSLQTGMTEQGTLDPLLASGIDQPKTARRAPQDWQQLQVVHLQGRSKVPEKLDLLQPWLLRERWPGTVAWTNRTQKATGSERIAKLSVAAVRVTRSTFKKAGYGSTTVHHGRTENLERLTTSSEDVGHEITSSRPPYGRPQKQKKTPGSRVISPPHVPT